MPSEDFASRCTHFFAQAHRDGKTVVLVIDNHLPQYDRHAGGLGMYGYLQLFVELGFAVFFIPDDRRRQEPYGTALRQLGIEVADTPFDFSIWIRRFGREIGVVWLSRPTVAPKYLSAIRASGDAKIIYCGRDLAFLRLERRAVVERRPEIQKEAAAFRKLEGALIAASDAILVFSSVECQVIKEQFGIRDKVHVVSAYVHDETAPPPLGEDLAERRTILFVGGFPHLPNVDAVQWFGRSVWPRVARALPDARFVAIGEKPGLVGRMPEERFDLIGPVPELDSHFAGARLSVAPIRYGAGVKGKIVDSLVRGVPVVATNAGAEGMGLVDGREVLLADQPETFADCIVRLWSDASLWTRLSETGRAFVARTYGRHVVRARLSEILGSLGVSAVTR